MFKRIWIYKRYKDYVSLKSFEVYLAIVLTLLFSVALFGPLDVYGEFSYYEEVVNTICQCIIAGEFGLLGMSLAGMAIITSLLTANMLQAINKVDKNDTINRVLSQFEFSAFNLVLQIIYMLFLDVCLSSPRELVAKPAFIGIVVVSLFHLFFNVLYILALIGNCIEINSIKTSYELISEMEKTTVEAANEVRIDYILAVVLKDRDMNKKDMIKGLNEIIDKGNLKNGEEVKKYFHDYYNLS